MELDLSENNRKHVRFMISYGCNLGFFFVYYTLGYRPRKVKCADQLKNVAVIIKSVKDSKET